MNKLAKGYIEYAKRDLNMMEHGLADYTDDMMISLAAYHCQQAIEKCIKSVYIENKIELYKVHDIQLLLNRLRNNNVDVSLFADIEEYSEEVTGWEGGTRYTAGLISSLQTIRKLSNIVYEVIKKLEKCNTEIQDIKSESKARRNK